MDSLATRFADTLREKVRRYAEVPERRQDVYLEDEATGSASAGGILAHEIFESFLLFEAAKDLKIAITSDELESVFSEFFRLLQAMGGDESEDINSSVDIDGLTRNFPRFNDKLQQRIHGKLSTSEGLALRIPEVIAPAFRAIVALHLTLLEEPTVRTYLEAIRTYPSAKWNDLVTEIPDPRSVAAACGEEEATSATIYHGFLMQLGLLAQINSSLGSFETREEQADAALVLEYVRAAIDWRIDLRTLELSNRFERIRDRVINAAAAEVSPSQSKIFRAELESMMDEVLGLAIA